MSHEEKSMLLGIILIIVGIILFFIRQNQSNELLSLQSARKTNVAELTNIANSISQEIGVGDWRDYVKIWGKITVNKPILSELKQEPCVYYEMKIEREYEEKKFSFINDTSQDYFFINPCLDVVVMVFVATIQSSSKI
ncbi:MAG: hypothetical protein IGQ45_08625 [Cyanobacterium sp. T60_A2020_053]|nr:hypothetical protein [Cyanobacterium sp. T60_A2020_053]